MIRIDWNPIGHFGPVPINWYGLGWVAAFVTGAALARRWVRESEVPRREVEDVLVWILGGAFIGARLYFVAQNDAWFYLTHPWRIVAVWEGGLAFFGGLLGATGAAYIFARMRGLDFGSLADLFAPSVPVAAAIGRIPCGFDGMDYGTPTRLPWGVVYENPSSYAPIDGVARHPDQFYEMIGDLIIAAILLWMRRHLALRPGTLFVTYLVLFSVLRFILFFVRGNVPIVALGLKNAQWMALAILAVTVPMLMSRISKRPDVLPLVAGRDATGRAK
jgi:phosphatidylglycerol:prolipoprotein diacylglycerol transferase